MQWRTTNKARSVTLNRAAMKSSNLRSKGLVCPRGLLISRENTLTFPPRSAQCLCNDKRAALKMHTAMALLLLPLCRRYRDNWEPLSRGESARRLTAPFYYHHRRRRCAATGGASLCLRLRPHPREEREGGRARERVYLPRQSIRA